MSIIIPTHALSAPPVRVSETYDADEFIEKWNNKRPFDLRNFIKDLISVESLGKLLEDGSVGVVRECFTNFLIVEEQIKEPQMFWTLFGYLFSQTDLNSVYLENSVEAVKRYDRHKEHLNQKHRWSNDIRDKVYNQEVGSVKNQLDRFRINDEMEVYRGFHCRKDINERIRETDDKNKDEFYNQKEGLGLSYSFDRNVAISFASRWTEFSIIRNTIEGQDIIVRDRILSELNIDFENDRIATIISKIQMQPKNKFVQFLNEEISDSKLNRKQKSLGDFDESFTGVGVRSVVGTYKVKKIDTLMTLNISGQQEVVVLPENAKLVRYDFLTSDEIKSAKGIHDHK